MSLLDEINGPEALSDLTPEQLQQLAEEIRAFLITNVSRTGGHLGPNLGVVELTIALHRIFDSPKDAIVFDTGHQSYVHKVLTGRKDQFGSLRQPGGLSGYPSRAESPHDWVENSHASTALSWADGLATIHQDPAVLREMLARWDDAGGADHKVLQVHVSWAPTDDEAYAIAGRSPGVPLRRQPAFPASRADGRKTDFRRVSGARRR